MAVDTLGMGAAVAGLVPVGPGKALGERAWATVADPEPASIPSFSLIL